MIRAVGQNFNTTTYKAKNNNPNAAFGKHEKTVQTTKKAVQSGWDHMNAVREVWDNAKPGEKVKDLKKKLGIKKFVYIFGK